MWLHTISNRVTCLFIASLIVVFNFKIIEAVDPRCSLNSTQINLTNFSVKKYMEESSTC